MGLLPLRLQNTDTTPTTIISPAHYVILFLTIWDHTSQSTPTQAAASTSAHTDTTH
jgi:hypothetical protein